MESNVPAGRGSQRPPGKQGGGPGRRRGGGAGSGHQLPHRSHSGGARRSSPMMMSHPADGMFMVPGYGADPRMFGAGQQGFVAPLPIPGQPPAQQPRMLAAQQPSAPAPMPYYPQQALLDQPNATMYGATGMTQGGSGNQAVAEGTPAMTGGAPLLGGTSNMGMNVEGINQLVQQDIERGLGIDFYAESNPALLASWATFFRDQFIETRHLLAKANNDRLAEAYRRATHFVERADAKVLETKAMKHFFRKHPLTPPNDSAFVDACYRIIIDYNMRNPPFEGFAFGSPTWRDYMWFKAGLMGVVDKGRSMFLMWYSQQITEAWNTFIHNNHDSTRESFKKSIQKVSASAMEDESSYRQAKHFYAYLISYVLSKLEEDVNTASAMLTGSRVRSFFSHDEEAFILAVLRYSVTEQGLSKTPQILSEAARLSKMLMAQEAVCTVDSNILLIETVEEDDVADGDEGTK